MGTDVSYTALIDELAGGQAQAIFIDDGGSRNHTLPGDILVPRYLLYAAVVVAPDDLPRLDDHHATWLDNANKILPGAREFHAGELVNPNSKSPWKRIDMESRAELLTDMFEILFDVAGSVVRGALGEEQYFDLVVQAQRDHPASTEAHHDEMKRHDHGLERAFHKALALHSAAKGVPTVIVQDAGRYSEQFKGQFRPEFPVWNGGVAYLPSEAMPGIQLADLAAYALFRLLAIKARKLAGKGGNPLDLVIESYHSDLARILREAWQLGIEADQALRERERNGLRG